MNTVIDVGVVSPPTDLPPHPRPPSSLPHHPRASLTPCPPTLPPGLPDPPALACLLPQDPRQFAVKDHNLIMLRAETPQQKVEWLGRLRRATEGARKAAR